MLNFIWKIGSGRGTKSVTSFVIVKVIHNFIRQTLDKELVDGNVITGHVVPDVLLFTRPLLKVEQKTATYTDKSRF